MESHIFIAHSLYVAIMLAGLISILVLSFKPLSIPKVDYLIAGLVPLWSGLAYLSIIVGPGVIQRGEHTIYLARYLDWIVTTPLLLISLCFTAMFYTKKNITLIIGVVSIDIVMIVCGIIADWSTGISRLVWYGIGVAAFLIVFYIVWGPLRQIALDASEKLYKLYLGLAVYITLLWIFYPLSWILGSSGYGIISPTLELYAFIVLPIFSKVGFSLFDLIGLRKLDPSHSPA